MIGYERGLAQVGLGRNKSGKEQGVDFYVSRRQGVCKAIRVTTSIQFALALARVSACGVM